MKVQTLHSGQCQVCSVDPHACCLSGMYSLGPGQFPIFFVELHLFACDSDTPVSVSWLVTLPDLPLTCTLLKVSEILAWLRARGLRARSERKVIDPWQDGSGKCTFRWGFIPVWCLCRWWRCHLCRWLLPRLGRHGLLHPPPHRRCH